MDITDRKQVEMELQESNHRLAAALTELEHTHQQLANKSDCAVGTMASGIAHDFNNMLAPIMGFTELLLLRPESRLNQEKSTYYLQAILLAAQKREQRWLADCASFTVTATKQNNNSLLTCIKSSSKLFY